MLVLVSIQVITDDEMNLILQLYRFCGLQRSHMCGFERKRVKSNMYFHFLK